MVADRRFSTSEHQIEFFYRFAEGYGWRCSCGDDYRVPAVSERHIGISEVVAWTAYKHSGKPGPDELNKLLTHWRVIR